jgi:hypothetical protein
MEQFLRYWLEWPSVIRLASTAWGWPLAETAHFVGLILLFGGVGLFDLRLLGVMKGLPVAPLRKLLPWGVFGFVLCVLSGLVFVLGLQANIQTNAYDVILTDPWLQLKLLFIGLAGLNLLLFYVTGVSSRVEDLGPEEDAPPLAKVIAGTSLFLWLGVIYWGRLIPWGLG